MKRIIYINVGALCLLFWASNSDAYDPGTHQNITRSAIQGSTLGDPNGVLADLGIDSTKQEFPNIQSDVGDVPLGPGKSNLFTATSPLTIQNLIAAGSVYEDEGFRSFCHFYDGFHSKSLNVLGISATYSAPEWAIGITDLGSPVSGECEMQIFGIGLLGHETQSYSLKNANDDFYGALTMQNKSDREQQYGDLFLSLGHAMHLLEDMAQPQHVRNDVHCDKWICGLIGKYSPSRYEMFSTEYDPGGYKIGSLVANYRVVDFSTIPTVTDKARSFWSTGSGLGLAEFTNSNFISDSTKGDFDFVNQSPQYPAPVWDGGINPETIDQVYADLGRTEPDVVSTACPQSAPCYVTFVSSTGYDSYTQSPVNNPKAATLSLFDKDLQSVGKQETFTLNDDNYLSAFQMLMPRAVGYSTGLINHFFRGRLSVTYDQNTPNSFVVTNVSSYAMQNGTLSVYYDAADGTRTLVTSSSNLSLDPYCTSGCNDSTTITFQPPTDPAPATAYQYMFVYQGTIGTEPGVAGFQIVPPVLNLSFLIGAQTNFNGVSFHFAPTVIETVDSDGNVLGGIGASNLCPIRNSNSCIPIALPPEQLAIYNGTAYTGSHFGVTSHVVASSANEFAYYIDSSHNTIAYVGGVAANNSGINVLYSCVASSCGPGLKVDVYDHVKHQKQQTISINVSGAAVPTYYSGSGVSGIRGINALSVNNSRMCIVYMSQNSDGTASETAILTDLQGGIIATLATVVTNRINSTDQQIACASTGNRQYVIASTLPTQGPFGVSPATLYVFDNDGAPINSLPVNGGPFNSIAATDNTIYLLPDVLPPMASVTISVFNRVVTRNGTAITSENIAPASSNLVIQTPAFDYSDVAYGELATAIAVDSYGVLNEPVQ